MNNYHTFLLEHFIFFWSNFRFIYFRFPVKSMTMEATEQDVLANQKALEEEVQNRVKGMLVSNFLQVSVEPTRYWYTWTIVLFQQKLAREEKFTQKNLVKLNAQWLTVMRAAKSKELKKEIEILSQTFGRIIDRKDTVIKASTKDIEEAEEQYNMALRSFLEAIEKMIGLIFVNLSHRSYISVFSVWTEIHTSTIDKLLHQYEQDVEQIKYEFREERARIIRDHQISITELQDIIYNMEKYFLDTENAAREDFEANMEEERNKVRLTIICFFFFKTNNYTSWHIASRRHSTISIELRYSLNSITKRNDKYHKHIQRSNTREQISISRI